MALTLVFLLALAGLIVAVSMRCEARVAPTSSRVVLLLALAFSALAVAALRGHLLSSGFLGWATLATVTAALMAGLVDAASHRIPNRVILGGLAVAAVLDLGAGLRGNWFVLLAACVAGVVGLLVTLPAVAKGMGAGDAKLAALVAFGLAPQGIAVAVAALLLGSFAAILGVGAFLAVKRLPRSTLFPFGPWLVAGMVLALGVK